MTEFVPTTGAQFDALLRERGLAHVLELLALGRKHPEIVATTITITQLSFRGRNDDGSESTATWIATENSNWTQAVDTTFRVRFELDFASSVTAAYLLQYSLNGGTFTTLTTSTTVAKLVASGTVADDTVTTNQLVTATDSFTAGRFDSNGAMSAIVMTAPAHTEVEFCLQIVGADVANGDTVQFRVVRSVNNVLTTYTRTPTVTVSKAVSAVIPARTLTGVGT